jgi:drug/metabolite transporter (DMT)-like permease
LAFASALVLLAALLHASWNAVLRGGRDRFWTMTVMSIAISVPALAVVPFLDIPAQRSWPYIVTSGILHVAYNLGLVNMYRRGNLGQAYPIARGSSPLLVALGAAAFAGERLGVSSVLGIASVSGGILALILLGGRLAVASLVPALITGACIATYTVIDGLGVRAANGDPAYIAWMFTLEILIVPIFLFARGRNGLRAPGRAFVGPVIGGVLSLSAYGIVIWALAKGPMGPISALRETSVVFAALIGWKFLREPLSWPRLAACCVIAGGAVCLGFAG